MWTTLDRFSEARWEERHRDRWPEALLVADDCEDDAVPTVHVADDEEFEKEAR
jgi:hypothetical protein